MIRLTDEEIEQAILEANKEMRSFKAHPRWESEKYLMEAQLKKLAEWGNTPCPHSQIMKEGLVFHNKAKRECSGCWQTLLKGCE